MLKRNFLGILFILAGAGIGLLFLYILTLPFFRFGHPLLATFGIRKPEIIGFLPYWLIEKADKNYEPFITTMTYFGLVVDSDGKPIYLVNEQEEEPGWTALKSGKIDSKLDDARKQQQKLSLLVHSADEDKINELLNDPITNAHELIAEVGPIMKDKGFTDLNLDIESFLPASESARKNFLEFVKTVRHDIDDQKLGTLTVEIAPIALYKKFLIDPSAIGELADSVVLMAYDYHYRGSFVSGPVAPIGGGTETIEFDVEMSIKEALKVIPKKKIILGIPLYGYDWETLSDRPGAPTIPGGASTATTGRIAGFLIDCATCSAQIDPISRQPYIIYREDSYYTGIYYENETSIKEKIALAQKYELGGIALWALGYEDDTILTPLADYKKSFRFTPELLPITL